jgi:hypothetical protein
MLELEIPMVSQGRFSEGSQKWGSKGTQEYRSIGIQEYRSTGLGEYLDINFPHRFFNLHIWDAPITPQLAISKAS